MHRNRKKRNIVIFSLVGVLFLMVAGYAAFSTNLEIKGTSKVTSNWDIEITDVKESAQNGLAENVKMYYEKLEASVEANLYDKGDSMEYDIENSNNDAVIITFSGYTKGEVLKSKATKIIHVKIEYNPEYEGGETSSEVEVNFDYTQNNNEENNPDSQYLLTYDYSTNGGQSVELKEELLQSGSNVDLSNTATKEGWNFVGWNTDKDAQIGLKEYQMPKNNTTLYAIYSKTLKVTYEKGDNIESIGKNEDSCNIYNNQTSCEVTLPEITPNKGYEIDGWYNNEKNIGIPDDKYLIGSDVILISKSIEPEPLMMARDDNYAFWTEKYRANVTSIDVLDNKNISEAAIASWDISAEENESVMAWIINDPDNNGKYKLYIGGNGGVIANTNLNHLFSDFDNVKTMTLAILDTSKTTNMKGLFQGCSSLTNIDIFATWEVENKFDTSKVTNMSYMFQGCSSLSALYLSILNTDNVTNISYMFQDCKGLSTLRINNMDGDVFWNTTKVTNMSHMFENCSSLGMMGANITKLNTSNVTDMSYMFSNSGTLFINSNLDTGKVTNMEGMFKNSYLSSFQNMITGLDVSNVTNMSHMFENAIFEAQGLIPNLSSWDTRNVTNMSYMFANASGSSSDEIYWSGNGFITEKVTNMSHMFDGSNFISLSLCLFDTRKVTDMSYMFANMKNPVDKEKTIIADVNSKYWTTANATTTNMFSNSSTTINRSETCNKYFENSSYNMMPTFSSEEEANKTVMTITYPEGCGSTYTCTYQKNNENPITVTKKTVNVTFTETGTLIATVKGSTNEVSNVYNVDIIPTLKSWSLNSTTDFHSQTYKNSINSVEILDNIDIPEEAVESWDVSEMQDRSAMAWVVKDSENAGYYKLYIGGDGGVKANTNSSYIFYGFEKLKYFDLIKLDTSSVTNMGSMFSNCSSLTTLDLSSFDTSSVTNMGYMFYHCSSLTTLDLSSFDTSSVTNMGYMFSNCSSLTTLDLSSFDTSSVTDMDSMFYHCSSLTTLDLSSFDTSSVTDMSSMFSYTNNLKTIYVGTKWTTENVSTNYMFYKCGTDHVTQK